jgi:hypothetical protein
MSARSHDFGHPMINSFYTPEMRNLAAAEHAVHALLAADGARLVYPRISHGGIPWLKHEVKRCAEEIEESARARVQKS